MQASFLPATPFVRFVCARAAACFAAFVLLLLAVVQPAHAEDDFLPPEQAFRFAARPHDAKSGEVTFDETFNKNVETYRNAISIVVPVEQVGGEFRLVVTSQGCADAGLCYPPMQSAAVV